MTNHWRAGIGVVAAAFIGLQISGSAQAPPAAVKSAVAKLKPTQGNSAGGEVTFTQEADGVRVTGNFSGVPFKMNDTKHGFHIHEFGDLTTADGTSAGGHFNPTSAEHGGPESGSRHAGDLGNLEADENGVAAYHAGVEWKWWPGPASCTGGGAVNAGQLAAFMNGAKLAVPQCDQAAWRLLGISMAGYNVLLSLALAIGSLFAARRLMTAGK